MGDWVLGVGANIGHYTKGFSELVGESGRVFYIEHEIRYISMLMCSQITEVLEQSDVIVVGKHQDDIVEGLTSYLGKKLVFDLVRIISSPCGQPEKYDGICW